ncbi:DUF4340 domain-containing protein [Chitinispirillales bacterium ANBcel5]|uniref:DUF4340 domain-containing protein n=1 Tax=Cellulosispirillum alkaliphilum TaxID=3039283 RepID=UPI002A56F1BE|nr:DUF4340 domain-containing protein [Chitinispirillales bacterium ANBcel5]
MNRKTLLALSVLIIVILIIVVSEKLSNTRPPEHSLRFFPGLNENSISQISIQGNQSSVKLTRDNNTWKVKHTAEHKDPDESTEGFIADDQTPVYRADSAAVQTILEKIVHLRRDVLVSENPDNQPLFEVDSESGIHVQVWDRSKSLLGSFYIGKSATDWTSHYVRLAGSNSVYTVPGGIRSSFFSDLNRWRDKRILSFDENFASRISISGSGIDEDIVLDRTENHWNINEPVEHYAAQDSVQNMLSVLSSLNATGFENEIKDKDKLGLSQPYLTVSVDLATGTSHSIVIGAEKEDSNNRFIMSDIRDDVFLISSNNLSTIYADIESLKSDHPPVEEPVEEMDFSIAN